MGNNPFKVVKINLPPSARDFRAFFDTNNNYIEVIPTETGIPRRISKNEWDRFAIKYGEVKSNGYDPLRPGHYAQITHNSSYLVAILKKTGFLKEGD